MSHYFDHFVLPSPEILMRLWRLLRRLARECVEVVMQSMVFFEEKLRPLGLLSPLTALLMRLRELHSRITGWVAMTLLITLIGWLSSFLFVFRLLWFD